MKTTIPPSNKVCWDFYLVVLYRKPSTGSPERPLREAPPFWGLGSGRLKREWINYCRSARSRRRVKGMAVLISNNTTENKFHP